MNAFRKTIGALALLLLVAFVLLLARSRYYSPLGFDEQCFVWCGWLINQGWVPYRDFFESKPPVIFYANALGLALFGMDDALFRIVPTAVGLFSIFVFHVSLRQRQVLSWLAVLLTAQVALWLLGPEFHDAGLNDAESYGFAFTLIAISFGWLSNSPGVRAPTAYALQISSGICLALAIFSKEPFLLSAAPAWLFVARSPRGDRWFRRQLLVSGAAATATGLLVIAFLYQRSALGPYLDLLRFYSSFAASFCIDLGRFPRVSGLDVIRPSLRVLNRDFYDWRHLAFVLPLVGAALMSARHWSGQTARRPELAVALAGLALGMVSISLGHCFWRHYYLMGATGLLLIGVMGSEVLSRSLSRADPRIPRLSMIVLGSLFLFTATPALRDTLSQDLKTPRVELDPLLVDTITKHSRSGDFILSTDGPMVYPVMDRRNSLPINSFFDATLPYLSAASSNLQMEEMRRTLERNIPKVVYFSVILGSAQQQFRQLLFTPFLVEHNYVKVTDNIWYLPDTAGEPAASRPAVLPPS